jgi:hypothetical protein
MPGVWRIHRFPLAIALALLSCGFSTSRAEEPLEEVVVSGEFPGPGMWKVTRADDPAGHELWIVGTQAPLPRRMRWKSREIEAVVLDAQEILLDANVTMEPDEKIGILRGITLLPAVLKARRNPDEARLEQLLPAELYARWLTQKKRYLGRERGVEEWRPIFAADKLRRAALDDLELRDSGMVWEVVSKLAEKHEKKVTTPSIRFTFKRSELRAKIKEFSRESLADVECFSTMLDYVEALSRSEIEAARARAWATGDIAALESLPRLPNPMLPCALAVMNSQVAREVIPADIGSRLHERWLDAAQQSLAANQTTVAIVPLRKLLDRDGYAAALRAKGFIVEAPR